MKHVRARLLGSGASILVLIGSLPSFTTAAFARPATPAAADPLLDGFRNPPPTARPRTWWHWTGGNVTEEGIDKDLAWMKRVGIGGFQLVDVASGNGQTVEPKINFGTPEWLHAVRHAADQAQTLGLEMSLFSSAGWSLAGGPWVTPDHAMKRLVWSETALAGGRPVTVTLPQPPSNQGPVRDLRIGEQPAQGFYRDTAVLAYREPGDAADQKPSFTSSAGPIDTEALLDDSLNTSTTIKAVPGAATWVEIRYARLFTARALSIGNKGGIPVGTLEASDDELQWRPVLTMPGPQGYHGAAVRTYAFPATTARFFRLRLDGAPLKPAQVINWAPVVPAARFDLTELKLFAAARVNRWEDKGAFGSLMNDYAGVPTPAADKGALIDQVIDLSGKMAPDGTLRWTPPPGDWKVIRFGYASTGARNRPSVPAGSGLEVDKLNSAYVADYVRGYLDPIQSALGPLFGRFPSYVTMDSWEAGMQNWTDDMAAEFKARRGYDPTPYLPVLAGHVVTSADVSDRFLWDFRRTLADLFADDFYGTMESELGKRGLKTYAEASGVALEIPEDTLRNKSKVDIPMAEFWVTPLHPFSEYYADVRGAASAGHVFGKPIVAAESFTGGWYESPYTLKKVADYWFAQGINRLVFHSTAMQPLDSEPGNTMVGTHINRNITWAEQARPFMDYVARNDYMLQQGRFVADVAYLLPEGAPATLPFWGAGLKPELPRGYDFDVLNTDALLRDATVDSDGAIRLANGMRYRVLVLPPAGEMSVAVARKLADLVHAGAWIVGQRPLHSTGLTDYPRSEAQLNAIAETLWGGLDGIANTQRQVGKGMVNWGLPLGDVLRQAGAAPDVEIAGDPDGGAVWLHRALQDGDIYYLASQKDGPQAIRASFRVTGREPELWDPVTGTSRPVTYRIADGRTLVSLDLAERQSAYLVFRKPAMVLSRELPEPVDATVAALDGLWAVTFLPGPGAPASGIELPHLASLTDQPDPLVRYFSGTAVYTKTLDLTPSQLKHGRLVLDLGDVRDLAKVSVNGSDQGILWSPPFSVDVTRALHAGRNSIEIQVTNEWTNRLEGDKDLPLAQKALPAAANLRRFFHPGHDLPRSGLLGPVRLISDGVVR